ncbi:PQQ-binding-like beta-propeller repeat protein [Lutimonas saemankumensis]|uniref:outer membrane protein assembly factor BamB family protein n=1 Tax=Lutimonas saemankumensis TaxID=483016 RepID=UPI001CD1E0BB|nr:PQQ-binding-like beta-propeller repeat protein [Lutimonas saemankumensis]MCA0931380.1 PQQ-binding-like beta-propeller repeat protein [Lutimonas saemankumensis]
MKIRKFKVPQNLIYFLFIIYSIHDFQAQTLDLKWKVETSGKILAGPVANDELTFVGNEKGTFMAIQLDNGAIAWKFETKGNIQAAALLYDNLVFFESANVFYALKQKTGKEVWRYRLDFPAEKFKDASGNEHLYKLDPFDDKRSSGFLYHGIIYIGCSNGKVIGLNSKTGNLEFSISAKDDSPIRSSPLVLDDQIYFGDWNGVVYCYDLKGKKFVWTKNTYREKPYATFGGIATEFKPYKGKLFFGARNPALNVLSVSDGQKVWTYNDPTGGWIIGDPVLFNDTLYMGGSDNFSMLAFNPDDGKIIWKTKRAKNIYGKAVVTEDFVIYGGGNSYDPKDTGELVILKRSNGELVTHFETSSSVFSSPVLTKTEMVIFGSNDGAIYGLELQP